MTEILAEAGRITGLGRGGTSPTVLVLDVPGGTSCRGENGGGCPPTSVVLGAMSPGVSLSAGSRRQGHALLP
jgi:hypothetical protein